MHPPTVEDALAYIAAANNYGIETPVVTIRPGHAQQLLTQGLIYQRKHRGNPWGIDVYDVTRSGMDALTANRRGPVVASPAVTRGAW